MVYINMLYFFKASINSDLYKTHCHRSSDLGKGDIAIH